MIQSLKNIFLLVILLNVLGCSEENVQLTPNNQPPEDFILNSDNFSSDFELIGQQLHIDWPDVNDPDGDSVTYNLEMNGQLVQQGLIFSETNIAIQNLSIFNEEVEFTVIVYDENGLSSSASFSTLISVFSEIEVPDFENSELYYQGDFHFGYQSQVNDYLNNGFIGVNGNVYVNSKKPELNGKIKAVSKTLWMINGYNDVELTGLDGVKYIGGHVFIENIPQEDISNFTNSIESIGGQTRIYNNQSLKSLKFPSLKQFGGITIEFNNVLHDIEFPNIERTQYTYEGFGYQAPRLVIKNNSTLEDFTISNYFVGSTDIDFNFLLNPNWRSNIELTNIEEINSFRFDNESSNQISVSLTNLLKVNESLILSAGIETINIPKLTDCNSLHISRNTIGDVSFSELEQVNRLSFYSLENTESISFPKVTNIETVSMDIIPQLTNIHFPVLKTCSKRIILSNLNSLINLDAFNKLESITGENTSVIAIIYNDNLKKITGFNALEILKDVRIEDNVNLEDYCGFQSPLFSQISGFRVQGNKYNPSLEDLTNGNCVE